MNQTIAHYKKWKIWPRLVVMGLIVVSVPMGSIWVYGSTDSSRHYHFAEKSMIIFAWFLAIPVIREIVLISKELVFHNGRLIWIANGEIIWQRRSIFSIRCIDVVNVIAGFGERSRFDRIIFRLRNGSEQVIESDSLDEPSDEVVSHLKQILNLD